VTNADSFGGHVVRAQLRSPGFDSGKLVGVELSLFEAVAELVRGSMPAELGDVRHRAHRSGLKVWFGPDRPPPEHYEAQVISARDVEQARMQALEVGFHAEHPQVADNDEVLTRLVALEERWRGRLGGEAVAGAFLGRPAAWRRISETWPDPDLDDPDLAIEVAVRLTDYVIALEPLRRDAGDSKRRHRR
jgi:hypothetical protein